MVQRRAAGITVAAIAAELGLAPGTVLKWSAQSRATRALVPVEIVTDRSSERVLSVVSPSGFRVEGLSLLEAAALLRALG
jgi:transposase-like protein